MVNDRFPHERIQGFTALLRARLGKKRYTHSINVANSAKELALHWGADPDWAYLAGLLHDCCKEIHFDEQEELMRGGRYEVSQEEWLCKPVWHGIAAASYMNAELGIEHEDVLNAVRWHTVGHANMSLLEEIVYMADLISADRSYDDVGHFRKLAFSDLSRAMLEALQFAVKSVMKKSSPLPVSTAEAYNYYLVKLGQPKKD